MIAAIKNIAVLAKRSASQKAIPTGRIAQSVFNCAFWLYAVNVVAGRPTVASLCFLSTAWAASSPPGRPRAA
jgi:hypothetical protein